jgi:hypothetical protein
VSDYPALREVSLALADRLRQRLVADPQLGTLFTGGHVVSLRTPKEMRGDQPVEVGLSVWLYAVERNEFTYNRPPERVDDTHLRRAPLPLNLHYLITPITDDPPTEQLIMGKVLQTLHEHPTLPADPARPELEEGVRITLQNLDLESVTRIWTALDEPYQLSTAYVVQAVDIRPSEEPFATAPVLEKQAGYAQVVEVA